MLVQNHDTGSMAECPRPSATTICLARRATATPLPCTRAQVLSGSVKALLMR